jgi:DDE superfamily endonuclease
VVADETGFVQEGLGVGRGAATVLGYGRAGRELPAGRVLRPRRRQGPRPDRRELYLAKSSTDDRDRCRGAGVADDVRFATKTDLARARLGRALNAGIRAAWVTADEAHRRDGRLRDWLQQRRTGYVVPVACSQTIAGDARTSRAGVLAAHVPWPAVETPQLRERRRGPRQFDWAAATLLEDGSEPPAWSRYLLVRRSLPRNGECEQELAYRLSPPSRGNRRQGAPRREDRGDPQLAWRPLTADQEKEMASIPTLSFGRGSRMIPRSALRQRGTKENANGPLCQRQGHRLLLAFRG